MKHLFQFLFGSPKIKVDERLIKERENLRVITENVNELLDGTIASKIYYASGKRKKPNGRK